VIEYAGAPPRFSSQDVNGCCSSGFDLCGVAFSGVCECPGSEVDADDCAEDEALVEAVAIIEGLADRYTYVTRLSTRVSPEEMDFDPFFEPFEAGSSPSLAGQLRLSGSRRTLASCESDIIDEEPYEDIVAIEDCASLYCGSGECVGTFRGAACVCDEGFVARDFTDLDGESSVTCVPEEGTVDFAAGGTEIPDVCDELPDVPNGACVAVGGFPTTRCDADYAAVENGILPICVPILTRSGSPGAEDFTTGIPEIDVCAPPPPSCSAEGWLERIPVAIAGVACSEPHESWFARPPAPTCEDPTVNVIARASDANGSSNATMMDTTLPRPGSSSSGGCSLGQSESGNSASWLLLLGASALFGRRRPKRRLARP
jgi:hypothetical protein